MGIRRRSRAALAVGLLGLALAVVGLVLRDRGAAGDLPSRAVSRTVTTAGRLPPSVYAATSPATTDAARPVEPAPLAGRVVVVDPGHNGANGRHTAEIDRPVPIGNGSKPCNTTGTASVRGLSESRFNWLVAQHVRRALEADGARVVMTRHDDRGVGPCVDRRARIANAAEADVAVSVHADGGPADGHGFHVILPGRVPQVAGHDRIVAPSAALGRALRATYRTRAAVPYANYVGAAGLDVRTDLGGLNLLRVPGVMIETGNMRNPGDAARMSDPAWRRRAGAAIATGVRRYLESR